MKQEMTFRGVVNEAKFTNAESMNQYIQYCVDNNIDIYKLHYSREQRTNLDKQKCEKCYTRYPDSDGCECGIKKLTSKPSESPSKPSEPIIQPWPEPYRTLVSYITPFVKEEVFSDNDDQNDRIIEDAIQKLTKRMEYVEENIISNDTLDSVQYMELARPMIDRLTSKISWCTKRIKEIDENNSNLDERIRRLNAELDTLISQQIRNNAIKDLYDEVGGYSSVVIDSLMDSPKYMDMVDDTKDVKVD